MTTRTLPTGVGNSPTKAHRASGSIRASGHRPRMAAAVSSSTRVAQASADPPSRRAARQATVCSGVLPAA